MASHNFIDLAGREFGRLSVLALADERGAHGQVKWRCRCACGAETNVLSAKLRKGHTQSCGCLKNRSGSENPNTDHRPVLERLAERSHVDPATGCKIWDGSRQVFGHGNITVNGQRKLVHRLAWETLRGPIPEGLDCLHNCPGGDNPACWNVDHLWLGTQGDNNADRDRKGRQVAPRGEQHGCAKLTVKQVLAIRSDGRLNYKIADEYGVSFSQVGRIKRRDAWGHLS